MALDLPVSHHTAVFRVIDQVLRSDKNLTRVGCKFNSWQGNPSDANAPSVGQTPYVQLTPVPRPLDWQYPDAQVGDLVVQIDTLVRGLAVDDVMNLYFAIASAVSPPDFTTANTLRARLIAAGAQSGLVRLSQPSMTPTPTADGGLIKATGFLSIAVLVET